MGTVSVWEDEMVVGLVAQQCECTLHSEMSCILRLNGNF